MSEMPVVALRAEEPLTVDGLADIAAAFREIGEALIRSAASCGGESVPDIDILMRHASDVREQWDAWERILGEHALRAGMPHARVANALGVSVRTTYRWAQHPASAPAEAA